MEAADFLPSLERESRKVTWGAVGAALLIEAVLLIAVGTHESWLGRPAKATDESNFIEAQVFVPQETHLVEESKP